MGVCVRACMHVRVCICLCANEHVNLVAMET